MTIQLLILWGVCFVWLSSSISIRFLGLVLIRNGLCELPLLDGLVVASSGTSNPDVACDVAHSKKEA